MARGRWVVAPDDDAAEMYLQAMGALDRAGYEQYEISNVARPGRESRHNLKYWTDGEWLGFGCGAHSTRKGVRGEECCLHIRVHFARRRGRTAGGRAPAAQPRQTRLEEALFMGLRLTQGIDLAAVESRYQTSMCGVVTAPNCNRSWIRDS